MFSNLKSLVNKSKQEKAHHSDEATTAGVKPSFVSPPPPSVVAKPDALETKVEVQPTKAPSPPRQPHRPEASASLIDVLKSRIIFIDRCLIMFALEGIRYSARGRIGTVTDDLQSPLLLHVPPHEEATTWASTFIATTYAAQSTSSEPDIKKARHEVTGVVGAGELLPSTLKPEEAEEEVERLAKYLCNSAGSDTNMKAVREILCGLYSIKGLVTAAAEAQGDSATQNRSVIQQGSDDRAVVQAVLVALSKNTNKERGFEVALKAEASIAAAILRLCEIEAISHTAAEGMPLPATSLAQAANAYTLLLLLTERQALMREIIGYQHRWVVAEDRRVAALKVNSLIVSREGPRAEPLPTTSAFTKMVAAQSNAAEAAIRSYANVPTEGSSLMISKLYTTIFEAPTQQFAQCQATNAGGPITHNMLLGSVKAPSEDASEWAVNGPSAELPQAIISLFPTIDVYRQCLLSCKGDLRARLQTLIDSIEGCGGMARALIDDGLAIQATATATGVIQSSTSAFATEIDLSPTGPTSDPVRAAANTSRQQLIYGTASLALPEKLRSVVVGIGVSLAAILLGMSADVNAMNAILGTFAGQVALLPEPLHQQLSGIRSSQLRGIEAAEAIYFTYAIGTEKWVTGIVGNSLHMRRSLEKIQSTKIAHVMNNSTLQGAMLAIKRLITIVATECRLEACVTSVPTRK